MSVDLLTFGRNITSEHGEDGIIEKIFEIVGTESCWCVELGALNGVHGSNVWHLIKEKNWSGVLLEADRTYFEKLKQEYAESDRTHCINAFVSFEGDDSLDKIFTQTPLPHMFDLFSLDIDGNEYHIWDSLHDYRPRLMVIEFNPSIPNDVSFVQPKNMKIFQGSSLRAIVDLGKSKGYELIATNDCNAFFVLKELFPKFGIADNSIDKLHTSHTYETKLFQLYDGTLHISGYDRLIWRDIPLDVEKLQVLSKRARSYPARIDESRYMRSFKYLIRKLPFYELLQRIRALLK
jgi:hypothetical protein